MAEIEKLGKVLSNILSEFLGIQSKGQVSQGIEIANEQLAGQLDIQMDVLLTLTKVELKNYLIRRKLTSEHLEILSDYIQQVGKSESHVDQMKARQCWSQAIMLLDIADELNKTASFDRIAKRSQIENLLQSKC